MPGHHNPRDPEEDETSDSVELAGSDDALHAPVDPVAAVTEEKMTGPSYNIVPDPNAENVDLSDLRGVAKTKEDAAVSDTDLENLAELVPDVKARKKHGNPHEDHGGELLDPPGLSSPRVLSDEGAVEVVEQTAASPTATDKKEKTKKPPALPSKPSRKFSLPTSGNDDPVVMNRMDSMRVQNSMDIAEYNMKTYGTSSALDHHRPHHHHQEDNNNMLDHSANPNEMGDSTSYDDDFNGSDHALEDQNEQKMPKEFMAQSSAQSISTATQTHEVVRHKKKNRFFWNGGLRWIELYWMNRPFLFIVNFYGSNSHSLFAFFVSLSTPTTTKTTPNRKQQRMPMYLPTFKPATGCTNASDFIVRCFVARLRCGITVVKHGRSRWCKSRLRILHIHPDGRSLSWKPAEGEPTSSKRPPKLDLSTCLEVRHAWSPDPQNPMYTGTPILRQKCEAANAHKSFALIFKQRTVDITAVTADQCKVLMEGFSALCFRLQVANLAGKAGAKKEGGAAHARPMPEEDGISTTASATLTNNSNRRQ